MAQSNEQFEKDNELADFTDRLLAGGMDRNASSSDAELLGLEKTLLRLTDAFPSDPLDEAKTKQMLVRLKVRARREEEAQAAKPSFWKRLFDFQSNPQVGLIFAVAAVVVLVVISLPAFQGSGSAVSGTASSGTNLFAVVGLIGVLLVIYWFSRRK